MKHFEILPEKEIASSLQDSSRQYLTGELARPQLLSYIHDKDVEAGITSYKEFTTEQPHRHLRTSEYMYMLAGESIYLNLTTNEEHHVKQGDFFVIRKDIVYAQKSKAGTKILFFKYPGGNDKVSVTSTQDLSSWYTSW